MTKNYNQNKNPIDLYIGTRLKQRRMDLNITQAKLAEKLGLTFQQLQKYEKGINRIGGSRLYELSKLLKVPVSYFFENYESLSKETLNGNNAEEQSKKDSLHRDIQKAIKLFESAKNHIVRKNMIIALKSILDSMKEVKDITILEDSRE